MINVLLILLIVFMLFTMSRTEKFGYAGYSDPIMQVVINDPITDTKEYTVSAYDDLTPDTVQKLVFATNEYVSEKTGLCTYVIETTSMKKYVHKETKKELYRCMFMLMKQHGFAFGFAVTADVQVNPDGTVKVLSARTQPMDVMPPINTSPFESDIEGHVFTDYDVFKKSELELIKNKSM